MAEKIEKVEVIEKKEPAPKPQKTIVTTVTIHAPGPDHVPFKFDGSGSRLEGFYDVEHHAPGTPVTLDAKEADMILKRFGGEEVTADGKTITVDPVFKPAPTVPTDPGRAPVKVV